MTGYYSATKSQPDSCDTDPKRLHTTWFHACDVLKKAKLQGQETDLWLPGLGVKGWPMAGNLEVMECLHPDW